MANSMPPASAALLLANVPLFSRLTMGELEDVVRIAKRARFSAGDVICRQGEPGMCLFVLTDGEVKVVVARPPQKVTEIARLGPGDLLGEISLIDSKRRSASIEAVTQVDAVRIDRASFVRLKLQLHPAAHKMLRTMAEQVSARLRHAHSEIADLTVGPEKTPQEIPERPSGFWHGVMDVLGARR